MPHMSNLPWCLISSLIFFFLLCNNTQMSYLTSTLKMFHHPNTSVIHPKHMKW